MWGARPRVTDRFYGAKAIPAEVVGFGLAVSLEVGIQSGTLIPRMVIAAVGIALPDLDRHVPNRYASLIHDASYHVADFSRGYSRLAIYLD